MDQGDPESPAAASVPEQTVAMVNGLRQRLHHLRERTANLALIPNLTGEAGDALRHKVYAEGTLSVGFMLMCGLSAGIAALGLLQSSTAVVIGAMLVSPLMTPIVALGFAFASLDGKRIGEAARVVAIGAVIGITIGALLTWISPIRNATPEILARTEPTLLDLAVALLSGMAGGYAIVRDKGATAIGVAIATALMPPLAVVGYGLGVGRFDYAGGAFLLFLTNLAAIALAIGVIARLSGSAKPFAEVELNRDAVFFSVLAFLALATPLGLTLLRVTHEATARTRAREAIAAVLGIKPLAIAQIDVKWPLNGHPTVDAVVVAPRFRADAQAEVTRRLGQALGIKPEVSVQQIVAADTQSQTRAMVDTALQRTVAGITSDVPPFEALRAALGIPVQTVWTNRSEHVAWLVPVPAPGWTLADYRDAESLAAAAAGVWQVRIVPPAQPQLPIKADGEGDGISPELALWAVQRWGLNSVALSVGRGSGTDEEARARFGPLLARLAAAQLAVRLTIEDGDGPPVLQPFGPPPAQRGAGAAPPPETR
ncbi:DUF389 domain-containing protein [Sandarakinorhabdus oryzae]|uniref:DUF389 domain-containing protein n=1 Tax=Sandarakinorhabdus oryzae TaxID=2675220 RepID=UPI0012E16F75|nr:DUF389 domain-containing protein [Sandarakinorhabdus oryzae]